MARRPASMHLARRLLLRNRRARSFLWGLFGVHVSPARWRGGGGQVEAVVLQTEDELGAAARERTFDALSEKHVEWTFDVVTGDAAHELLNLAKRRRAALI